MKRVVVMLILLCGLVGNAQANEWFRDGELSKYRGGNVELSVMFETMIVVMYEYDYTDKDREFTVSDEDYAIIGVSLKEKGSDIVYVVESLEQGGFEGQFAYMFKKDKYPELDAMLYTIYKGDKEMMFSVIYEHIASGDRMSKSMTFNSISSQIALK